jgi:hypothetical protein
MHPQYISRTPDNKQLVESRCIFRPQQPREGILMLKLYTIYAKVHHDITFSARDT